MNDATPKEEPYTNVLHLVMLVKNKFSRYEKVRGCVRWSDVSGLCEHEEVALAGGNDPMDTVGTSPACYVFITCLDKPILAACTLEELMPVFLKVNTP